MSTDLRRDVLVVCGLGVEARIARGPGVRTVAGGGRSVALAAAIEREIAAGVLGIVSFGVAGALVPQLRPGALIVAKSIIFSDRTLPVDARWSSAIMQRLPDAVVGAFAGSDRIVVESAIKEALHRATGAIAVDMESHVAARAAAAHGLPFVALRAVADPVERTLPPAATIAMLESGEIDLMAVFRSIAGSPGQVPALIAIGRDMRRATGALVEARGRVGAGMGFG